MKAGLWVSALALLGLGGIAGWIIANQHSGMVAVQRSQGPCDDGAQPLHWAAPMDPGYQRSAPGKSPMGMDLVPVCAEAAASDVDVRIDAGVVQNLGVRTATVAHQDLARTITAVGTVRYDETSFQMIHARAEGWLEGLSVESGGATVNAGQRLYALFSPKLMAAEQEYLSALATDRPALMQAAGERLVALGYSVGQIDALRQRGAPAAQLLRQAKGDGVVTMLGVRDGQFVSPGTHIMTLASLDTVWVEVDVLERDAGAIRLGAAARVSVPAWPGRVWEGRVDHVYPSLDPVTRSLKVRLVFANADRALQPNMFARASIQADTQIQALSVPVAALIRSGQGARVVRRVGPGQFDVVPVQTGVRTDSHMQVISGLEAGDEVVVSGQFLLDSEANLDAETLRLRAEHMKEHGAAAHPTHEHASSKRPKSALTLARVIAVDPEGGRITLEHERIESMGMAAMTMPFSLGGDLDVSAFKPGDEVRFALAPGSMAIERLERVQ